MNQQHDTDDILAPTGGSPTIAGGARTEPQSAEEFMERNLGERADEQTMYGDQQNGEVGQQTVDLKPSAGNPDSGLPANPTGSENTGGANPTDDESQKKTLNDADAVASSEPARAATDNDEKFLALAAEFQNYRNAANRRVEEARERAARNVLEDLLPVLDNLETGLKYVRDAKDAESMKQGIEFIAQQFRDVIKNHGVEAIEAQGQPFDPLRHDALEEVASDAPEGTVVEETQRGYSYKGAVLRPARVRVAGK
ncbi:MAG TPA: nucleotide exchange factor GrpE [Abditibacteriaceae bacterium]|jgi:molecular chaperone GrpE